MRASTTTFSELIDELHRELEVIKDPIEIKKVLDMLDEYRLLRDRIAETFAIRLYGQFEGKVPYDNGLGHTNHLAAEPKDSTCP